MIVRAAGLLPSIALYFLVAGSMSGGQREATPDPGPSPSYDHHVHLLSPHLVRDWKSLGVPFSRPDSFYSSAAPVLEGGVERAIVLSMAYLYGSRSFRKLVPSEEQEYERVRRENDFVATLARSARDRLAGFGSVNPLRPYAAKEAARCHAELGLVGLKLHFPNSAVDLGNKEHLEQVGKIFALAQDRAIPILVHLNGINRESGPREVEILMRNLILPNPRVEVYIAHIGGSGAYSTEIEEVLNTFIKELSDKSASLGNQVFFDLSAVVLREASYEITPPDQARLNQLAVDLRRLGLQRVLFGSDHPVFNALEYARTVRERLPLKKEEIDQILNNEAPALGRLR